jgi:hypothetical protein
MGSCGATPKRAAQYRRREKSLGALCMGELAARLGGAFYAKINATLPGFYGLSVQYNHKYRLDIFAWMFPGHF